MDWFGLTLVDPDISGFDGISHPNNRQIHHINLPRPSLQNVLPSFTIFYIHCFTFWYVDTFLPWICFSFGRTLGTLKIKLDDPCREIDRCRLPPSFCTSFTRIALAKWKTKRDDMEFSIMPGSGVAASGGCSRKRHWTHRTQKQLWMGNSSCSLSVEMVFDDWSSIFREELNSITNS